MATKLSWRRPSPRPWRLCSGEVLTSPRRPAGQWEHRPQRLNPIEPGMRSSTTNGRRSSSWLETGLALEQRWTDCEEHLSPTNLTSAARIGDPRRSCFRPVPGPEVGSPRDGGYPSCRFGCPLDLGDDHDVR